MRIPQVNASMAAPLFLMACMIAPMTMASATTWQGYARETVSVDQRVCVLISPHESAPGKPWMLRANPMPLDAEMDRALLKRGFHIVYMDVEELYGNADATNYWDSLHAWLTAERGFAPKPALTGKGHGALLVHAWAAKRPHHVACIHADTPWLRLDALEDRLRQRGMETLWDAIRTAHEDADQWPALFEAQADMLGNAQLPVIHLSDENDVVAPRAEHSRALYERYRRAGRGVFEILNKPRGDDAGQRDLTAAVLYFILKHCGQLTPAASGEPLPDMPEWRPAEFAGGTGIYVLDDILIIEEGNDMTGIVWTEDAPTIEYEISLEAMRMAGGDFFCGLTAPYHDSVFSLIIGGWGGTCVGISSLDWLDAYHNDTARFRSFEEQRWYRIRLQVSDGFIEAWIDDEQLVNVDVAEREVDIRWEMAPTKPLGIATWRTTGAVRNFQVRQF